MSLYLGLFVIGFLVSIAQGLAGQHRLWKAALEAMCCGILAIGVGTVDCPPQSMACFFSGRMLWAALGITALLLYLSPLLLELCMWVGWIEQDGRMATRWFIVDLVFRLISIAATILLAVITLASSLLRLTGTLESPVTNLDALGLVIGVIWIAFLLPQLLGFRQALNQL